MGFKAKSFLLLIIPVLVCAYVVISILNNHYCAPKIKLNKQADSSYNAYLPANSNTYFYDFENLEKKDFVDDAITHSGKKSLRLFGEGYSHNIDILGSQVDLTNANQISLSAWVYIKSKAEDPNFFLVFTIEKEKKSLFWYGNQVSGKNLELGHWFKISSSLNLDSNIALTKDCIFKLYFWNKSQCDVLIDDITVVFGQENKKGNYLSDDPVDANTFKQKFNFPPFTSKTFSLENIGNKNERYLINNQEEKYGEFKVNDKIFVGNFIELKNKRQNLLVAESNGSLNLYNYCENKSQFSVFSVKNKIIPKQSLNPNEVFIGDFNSDLIDELLYIDKAKKQIILCKISIPNKTCTDEKGTVELNKISSFLGSQIPGFIISPTDKFLSADVDGDKNSEIIKIDAQGKYMIVKYNLKKWQCINSENKIIPIWNSINNDLKIVKGNFLKKFNKEVLLTVYKTKKARTYNYTIFAFNENTKAFDSFYIINGESRGEIIGLDTLKSTDLFIVGNYDNDKQDELLRFNKDWRYNLKEIKFNDTTFAITSNIDFAGFKKSQNPKYYEDLEIISGYFLHKNFSSLMTIKRNRKEEINYLPNSIEIYSPKFSK